jgi:hypothetical protein
MIDFSPGRVEQTRDKMREFAAVCGLKENARASLEELIINKPHRQQFYKVAWLFKSVTEYLVSDVGLDEQIKAVLRQAEIAFDGEYNPYFRDLCLKANSQWDAYIRNLTPPLPTTLSDLLSVSLLSSKWLNLVLQELTYAQRTALFRHFKLAARSFSGVTIGENSWPAF